MRYRFRGHRLNPASTQLFNQNDFYAHFERDLRNSRSFVMIDSPFMTRRRCDKLLPIFELLRKRGITVCVNTRNPDEHDGFYTSEAQDIIQQLQAMGARVIYTVRLHRKTAIIDNSILWEGSLNILSFNDSAEHMRRTESEEHCQAMLQFTGLKEWIDDTMRNRYER